MSQVTFTVQPSGVTKDTNTAYALAALGCCGFCGLHRFYLDKIGTGIIWFLTGGVCCIGQCIDICTLDQMVSDYNRALAKPPMIVQPATLMVASPPMAVAMAQPMPLQPATMVLQPGQPQPYPQQQQQVYAQPMMMPQPMMMQPQQQPMMMQPQQQQMMVQPMQPNVTITM
ncbi:hypothetical protein PAPYR_8885 [Paratrimastix pyriformis]|uniref:TM2 domain-containing protein n=1 Tax=Paratrimastix pyriformis TaxID=342808 RepID=A0ABQ8U9P8_9EUKA|nr:hypothetical protein PAPYR_8885 [Paratrimastix pyriformis]